MSTVVDQRVVQMQFDNKQFESGVSTTMSTLDKLKQKLNFTGASKGLENVNTAAKNVNMTGLTAAVQTVQSKFSAMEVVGVTALANITNSAVNAGKRMISALTIDPVKTGFQEYETQINSTQTILANTKSKGSTIEDVNRALEELNLYADKTIYNFTEMTRNIGTFTAAGIELDTATNAIQGIANLAAVSGSTSQQASTAMYQLSQALASGTVKLMDWNSVVNAGMGGEMFQNALKETSKLLGTGAEAAIKSSGSFRESLKDGWLTAEVLTETLKKFTTTGANEYIADYTGLTLEAVQAETKRIATAEDSKQAMEEVAESLAKASGKSKEEIYNVLDFAKTAEDAATKVKTFTQLWDVMKESAQSGWAQTWKILVGDFEEAKALLTPLADALTGFIGKMSDARNKVLELALDNPFTNMMDRLKGITGVTEEMIEVTKDYGEIVNKVIGGDYGNGQARWDKLAEEGYNWAKVQNLVNEQLGSTVRHNEEVAESQKKVNKVQGEANKSREETIEQLANMSYKQLHNLGYTNQEIEALWALKEASEKTGIPIKDLVKDMDQLNGRTLLINSFKNIGQALIDTFTAIKNAWQDVFPPKSVEERAAKLYDLIAAFHKFTLKLQVSEDTADKLQRTFKGVFAIVDVLTTILGGGFKIAFKVLTSILSYFNMDILDLTAHIGDALVAFRDWFDSLFDVSGLIEIVGPAMKNASTAVKGWIDTLKKLPGVQKLIESISNLFNAISSAKIGNLGVFDKILSFFNKILGTNFESIGEFIIEGLIKGLGNGITAVIDFIANLASTLIDKFCDLLGIQSPSKVFMALGGFIIAGLIAGIKEGLISVPESIKGIVDKCVGVIQSIDWGTIMALGISVAGLVFIKKVGDALENFSAPFAGIGDILKNVAEMVDSLKKVAKAAAFNLRMKGIKQLAIAIALIAGSVILLVHFGGDDYGKMWNAVGIITVLAIVLAGLSIAMDQLASSSVSIEKGKFSLSGLKSGLLTMAAAIAVISGVIYLLGKMDPTAAKDGFKRLGVIVVGMIAFIGILGGLTKVLKNGAFDNVDKIGVMMLKIGIAMVLMVGVCKLVSKLSGPEMLKGVIFIGALSLFIMGLSAVAKKADSNVSKVGGMMIKIAIAMGLMVGVCKLIRLLNPKDVISGAAFALAFVGFVKLLVKVTKIGKEQQIAKLGGLLLSISISMMLMVGVCKLVGLLTVEDVFKGIIFVSAFTVFVWALVKLTKIGTKQQIAKISGTILAVSIAVGILAAVAMLLSLMSVEGLAKGVTAVSILCGMMALMIKSLQGIKTKGLTGTLIIMVVAIALMASAVAALSLIPDHKKLWSAVGAISLLMAMFAGLLAVTKIAKTTKTMRKTLIEMIIVMGALAGLVWALSRIKDPTGLMTKVGALSALMLVLAGMVKIISLIKITKAQSINVLKSLGGVVIAMYAIVGVLALMQNVDKAITSAGALAIVMSAMALMMVPLIVLGKLVAKNGAKVLLGLIGLAAVVVAALGVVGVLALMQNIENAVTSADALTKLMLAMTILMVPTVILGGIIAATGGLALLGLVALAGVVASMYAVVGVLALMNKVQNATANAELLIGMMNVMTSMLTHLAIIGPLALVGVVALAGLTLLIGAIGLMVIAMGALNELTDGGLEKLINSGIPLLIKLAEGIGTMIGAFVSSVSTGLSEGLVTIGDGIAKFMGKLAEASENAKGIDASSFEGVWGLVKALVGVGFAATGMSIADYITSNLGDKTAIEKFQSDGVAFFAAIKEIANAMKDAKLPDDFDPEGLKTLIGCLASVAILEGGVSMIDMFTKAIGDQTAIEKFKTDGEDFFEAIAAISEKMCGFKFPADFDVDGFKKLLGVLTAVGDAMADNSWSDILVQISSGGTKSDSMVKFEADGENFFEAIKSIGEKMCGFKFPADFDIDGFKKLLGVLTAVGDAMGDNSWSDILVKISSGGHQSNSMTKFEADGENFFEAIKAIGEKMCGFSFPADFSTEGLKKLFDTFNLVGEYTKGATWDSIWTFGGTTMERFEEDAETFFDVISDISTQAASITVDSFTNAKTAITNIKDIIGSVKGIDYSGVEAFTGVGTGGIGADGPMHDIGVALKDFGEQVDDIDVEAVNTSVAAADTIRSIISKLVSLDTSGIENFKAEEIGDAIAGYAEKVDGIDTGVVDSSITAANRLRTFIGNLVGLDSSGIAAFNVKTIGDKMKAYADAVVGIDTGVVSSSISAANRLKSFITSLVGFDGSGVSSFKTAVEELGTVQVGNVTTAFTEAIPNLTNLGANLVNAIADGIHSKQAALTNTVSGMIDHLVSGSDKAVSAFSAAGTNLMDKFNAGIRSRQPAIASVINSTVDGISDAAKKLVPLMGTTGAEAMGKFAQGLKSQNTAVSTGITTSMASAITTARGYYGSFYSAGSYLVDGFASGISANSFKAEATAAAMASAAYEAAKEALDINSPSKIFRSLGYSIPEGFAMGIDKLSGMASNSAVAMADIAIDGVKDSISRIADVINSDMDSQPTIRPVLDLSNVQSGAAAINGMFSRGATVGVQANVNSISSMMNDRIQNGANDDVVSAINKLRGELSNVGGTTYSINGITYDDGSNISDAIKSIARVAKMERRI